MDRAMRLLQWYDYNKVITDLLLDLVFPRFCLSCSKWGYFICPDCQRKITPLEQQICFHCHQLSPQGFTHPRCRSEIDGLYVFAHYKGPMKKIIYKIKYDGLFAAIPELAKLSLS